MSRVLSLSFRWMRALTRKSTINLGLDRSLAECGLILALDWQLKSDDLELGGP